ncbi:hypothetical protein [Arvimicrobium flavum]|uniref:hypothetical protein n=1 Tax=Arvimicrobium flavum TaxID=3393320 RepID=UPI00237BC291|nr:hypothetical protein [Mesorhizobium shangrilense]
MEREYTAGLQAHQEGGAVNLSIAYCQADAIFDHSGSDRVLLEAQDLNVKLKPKVFSHLSDAAGNRSTCDFSAIRHLLQASLTDAD